jgi:DNA-binding NarL/FixJ family response regulator
MTMPENAAAAAVADPSPAGGTDPDLEVLRMLAAGCSSTEIADRLGLGASTTKKRIERVYGRIGCQTRQQQAAEHVARHGYELPDVHNPCLTERQAQVLDLIAQGHSNVEIAAALGLSESTTRTHIAGLYSRIGVRNRAQATRYALTVQAAAPA